MQIWQKKGADLTIFWQEKKGADLTNSHIFVIFKVISQKVKLGQQLENWQIDMQNVLEEQIELKLTKNLGLTKF